MLLFCYRIISVILYHNAALYAMQALPEQFAAKRKKAPREHSRGASDCQKPLLLHKDNRAAGELEGARPASSWIIAIKNA